MRILMVGAGGYVGGRLVPALLAAGHELTLVSRHPKRMAQRFPDTRVIALEPHDRESLGEALGSAETVYALPEAVVRHGSSEWAERLRIATEFGALAASSGRIEHGLPKIIHLGQLGDAPRSPVAGEAGAWSEVGAALAAAGAPVIDLRASLIIGSGSAPFEMVRHLTDRVAIMTTPRWVEAPAQPIAIRDVLAYLTGALGRERTGVVEIGGADVLSFADMLLSYARIRGLHRIRIPLPLGTPWASDLWVSLVSPLPSGVARSIIDCLGNGAIVRDASGAADFGVTPLGYEEATRLALERLVENRVETTWFDAFDPRGGAAHQDEAGDPLDAMLARRRLLLDRRSIEIAASPPRVFAEVERLGGSAGWPAANLLWRARGLIDRLVGGVGMRLGRRDREQLRVGDAVDFWRVEVLERPHLLRLQAAMRVPGRAWLQYDVEATGGGSRLTQTAYFAPDGVAGYAYWFVLLPVHRPIFGATVRVLARRATGAL